MILYLIRAGIVLTIVKVWKTFALATDSSDSIVTAMNSVQKTSKAKAILRTQTKAKSHTGRKATNLEN